MRSVKNNRSAPYRTEFAKKKKRVTNIYKNRLHRKYLYQGGGRFYYYFHPADFAGGAGRLKIDHNNGLKKKKNRRFANVTMRVIEHVTSGPCTKKFYDF
jgi:hypothetical protein